MVTIRINNKKIKVSEDKTILQIAKENGIDIPVLCGGNEKESNETCGLCVVNIVGKEGLSLSCKTYPEKGMKVYTESRSVNRVRKIALELMLSDHYANCNSPCVSACPLGLDIETMISYISNGDMEKATEIVTDTLPMPSTVSRLCPAYCQNQCYRSLIDEPIKIKELVRYLADKNTEELKSEALPKIEKNIGIVGAGAAGLSCGYHLSKMGYNVEVLETLPEAGGHLRYSIPDFILPKKILKKEIENLKRFGMKIKTGVTLGKDFSLAELSDKYDAVFIATGLQKVDLSKVKKLKKSRFVLTGKEFLKLFHSGKKNKVGNNVVIYGGNEIAINCARILQRQDCNVTTIYHTNRENMPIDKEKLAQAENEGVKFIFQSRPVEIIKERGKLKKIKINIINPETNKNETVVMKSDTLILSTDLKPDISYLINKKEKIHLSLNSDNKLKFDMHTHYSGINNIFVGGDLIYEKITSISKALADGKDAANSIHNFLSNNTISYFPAFISYKEKDISLIDKSLYKIYPKKKHSHPKIVSLQPKAKDFSEINRGFNQEEMRQEADLCLSCGCHIQSTCKLKKYATEYKAEPANYFGALNKYPIDNSNPFIEIDPNKCIKCGLCIDACTEVLGKSILSYVGKGFSTHIAPELSQPLALTDCIYCGKCTEVCPTAAIYPKNINYKLNSRPFEESVQNCGLCGLGCEIITKSQDDKLMIISPSNNGINKNNLCFEGKFGWQVFEKDKRIKVPYIRVDKKNDWQEENPIWKKEENYNKIAKSFKKNLEKADKKAIYIGPNLTIEEILMLKTIAKKIDAQIYSFTIEKTFMDMFYNTIYTEKNFNDLNSADTIVVVGEIPLVLRTLIHDLQKKGKRLIVITQENSEINNYADMLFDSTNINTTLEKIIEYNNMECSCSDSNCECNEEDILQVELPPKTLFVYNKHRVTEQIIANILRISYQICSEYTPGSGLFEISDFINTKTFIKMQIPKYSLQILDFVILYADMPNTEQLKWLEKSKFVASFDTHLEPDNIADVFIPKPDYLSIDGIALSDDLRVLQFKNVKKEKYFENILAMFKNAGLLSKKESNPTYWNEKAAEFINSLPKPTSFSENRFAELIESIEGVEEKIYRYYPVYYFEINKLKKSIK